MKAKKVERRHALEERQQPEVDQQQHQQIEVGGVSAETSSGDSVVKREKKSQTGNEKSRSKKEGSRKEKIRAALFLASLLLLDHNGSWESNNG